MNKVLFVYVDYDENNPTLIGGGVSHGLAALAGSLKQHQIEYKLLHVLKIDEKEFIEQLKNYDDYRIIALSFTTPKKNENYYVAELIKRHYDKFIIAGGVHPTLESDEVISNENIDCVCVGEGEQTIVDVVKNFDSKHFENIHNIYFKKDGKIIKNQIGFQLSDNLDDYPFPDYSIYDFSEMHCMKTRLSYLPVMVSRGCPFNCSFCANYVINKRTGKKTVRHYSPSKAVEIIQRGLELDDFYTIGFDDDIVFTKKDWNKKFLKLYKKEINLPFKCYAHAKLVYKNLANMMKEAGCFRVTFGLESGNEKIRNNILNKKINDRDYKEAFNMFKSQGIQVNTSNMIGLPTENFNNLVETIKFNAFNNVDKPLYAIFTPYPYTELYDYCKTNKLFNGVVSTSEFTGSCLKFNDMSNKQILFIMSYFNLLFLIYKKIKNNRFLIKCLDLLIVLFKPLYPLFTYFRFRFFHGWLTSFIYRRIETK